MSVVLLSRERFNSWVREGYAEETPLEHISLSCASLEMQKVVDVYCFKNGSIDQTLGLASAFKPLGHLPIPEPCPTGGGPGAAKKTMADAM